VGGGGGGGETRSWEEGGGFKGCRRGREWLRRWGFKVSSNTERIYVYAKWGGVSRSWGRGVKEACGKRGKGVVEEEAGQEEEDAWRFVGSVLPVEILDGETPAWGAGGRRGASEGGAGHEERGEGGAGHEESERESEREREREREEREVGEALERFVREWSQLRAVEKMKVLSLLALLVQHFKY
jgi:hypothetical protein